MDSAQIINLIQKGDLFSALHKTQEALVKEEEQFNVLQLIREYEENDRQLHLGLHTQDAHLSNTNRIRFSLLHLLTGHWHRGPHGKLASKEDARQFYDFGNIQLRQHAFFKAIYYFDKAIFTDAELTNAYIDRGTAKCALRLFEEAIPDFDAAIERAPRKAFAYLNRGIAWFELGDKDKACQNWRKVKELNFDVADDYLNHFCR